MKSDAFRIRWTAPDVCIHGAGLRDFHHPVVGELSFAASLAATPAEAEASRAPGADDPSLPGR